MRRHLKLEPFLAEVYLVDSVKAYEKLCREISTEVWRPWASAGMCQDFHLGDGSDGLPEYHVVMCVDKRVLAHKSAGPHDQIRLIAHEATHAAGMILDRLGHSYDGVDEPLAYLVGHLTQWAWSELIGE